MDFPLEDPDGMWQLFADDYLEYLSIEIAIWGDSGGRLRLSTYDQWLLSTGRRKVQGLPRGSSDVLT